MNDGLKITVALLEVIDALDTASDDISFYLNLKDGRIIHFVQGQNFSDLEDEDIDEDEGEWIPEHYIRLPDRDDINKYGIMEDFCYQVADEVMKANLLNAISGSGAFGRFHTAIHCYRVQEDWYQFLHDQLKEISIQFCKARKLNFTYKPRPKKPSK